MQGFVSTLDTYASQAFTGNIKRTGIYLQKALLVTTTVSVFIALIWFFSYYLFIGLQLAPDVSYLAQQYMRYLVIGIPANIIFTVGSFN